MATLTVGIGKQYSTIAAAVAAAQNGDTVAVSAGTYVNDFATVKTAITLVAVGGAVTLQSTSTAALAPAFLTVTANATVNGFTFSGLRTLAGTGAGILVQAGNVTVENSVFTGNQNGILTTDNAATVLSVQNSEFARNGNTSGTAANINAGAIKSLTVTGSYIHDAAGGSEIRSLAAATTITGSRIEDNTTASAVAISLPNGGAVTLASNAIEKGAASTSPIAIQFGGGTLQAASSLTLNGNVLASDRSGATLLQNSTSAIASLAGNTSYGFTTLAAGPATLSGNIAAMARPNLATAPTPSLPAPINYGRPGAVTPTGHILTVGAGGQYGTLAAALTAATDGDTIQVQAGTYLNDTATVSHKVIIEGIGGLAQFIDTAPVTTGAAHFVTTTDVTFQNIEIFGANTAAILATAGNLTVDNSDIHNNGAGIVATSGATSVGIFDTEIAANTAGDVATAQISTLTLGNDYLHGATAGPEIQSSAINTTLTGDRVVQSSGTSGAPVQLPNGGAVTITGSAIEEGAAGVTAPVVQIGGGATTYAGSTATLTNNTLISDATLTPTIFVNDTITAAPATVTATIFAGGAAGSTQVAGGTNTSPTIATGVTVATNSPWGATAAPTPGPLTVTAPSGGPQGGQLILDLSETAWHGDAQFTLAVDGAPVGGILTVTAAHAAGQTETITIAGPFAAGPHSVALSFVNSLGTTGAQRALYLDGASYNGQDLNQTAALTANSTHLITTAPITVPTAVTLDLSETAWHGDALAFISIDGKVQGGVQTVTAAHATGQTQAISFPLDLAPGAHTASVTFLNGTSSPDGSSRNLYIDALTVGGAHIPTGPSPLTGSGAAAFAFTVAPPSAANGSLFVTLGAPMPLGAIT